MLKRTSSESFVDKDTPLQQTVEHILQNKEVQTRQRIPQTYQSKFNPQPVEYPSWIAQPLQSPNHVDHTHNSFTLDCTIIDTIHLPLQQQPRIAKLNSIKGQLQTLSQSFSNYHVKYLGCQLVENIQPNTLETHTQKPQTSHHFNSSSQPKYSSLLHILAQPHLMPTPSQHKPIVNKTQFTNMLILHILPILNGIHQAHQLDFVLYPNQLQSTIYITNHSSNQPISAIHPKLATHLFTHISQLNISQLQANKIKDYPKWKKQVMKSGSHYQCPQFMLSFIQCKDIRKHDTWRVAIWILKCCFGVELGKEIVDTLWKIAQMQPQQQQQQQHILIEQHKLTKLNPNIPNKFLKSILNCLSLQPFFRPTLFQLLTQLTPPKNHTIQSFTQSILQAKQRYIWQHQQINRKFLIEISHKDQLLTVQHKKKLVNQFKIGQNRTVKSFQLFYRASQCNFSTKKFHEVCHRRQHILIIVSVSDNKSKKIIAYSQPAYDLFYCNGIFGGFIKDPKKLSFLYSPTDDQFFKLKDIDKAIGVSYNTGPVFGDGDILISDALACNVCRFPVSYQSGRTKKLLKNQVFTVSQYDVYQVTFEEDKLLTNKTNKDR